MYIHKIIEIAMGLLVALTMSGCTPEDYANISKAPSTIIAEEENTQNGGVDIEVKTIVSKEEVIKLVNNEKPADELIKTIYAEAELKTFIKLSSILQERPPECARYSNDKLYLIYRYDENNYLFLMYNSIDEDSFPVSSWYLGKEMYSKDFESLADKGAPLNEVQEFDPHGDYTRLYASSATSLYTFHHTIDGYLIRLDYTSDVGKPLAISKITKFDGEDNPIYYNLLSIDKELIG